MPGTGTAPGRDEYAGVAGADDAPNSTSAASSKRLRPWRVGEHAGGEDHCRRDVGAEARLITASAH